MRMKLTPLAVLSCSLFVAGAAHAQLGLTIDLRATRVNGVPINGAQTPHSIPNANVGDVIQYDIYALVVGTNANFTDDRVIVDAGSFKSSRQGVLPNLLGTMDASVVPSVLDKNGDIIFLGFDGPGHSVGNRADLDGDSDIDVGSNDPSSPSPHWVIVYDLGSFNGAPAGLPNGRHVGFGTFTVTSASPGSQTLINFFGRASGAASSFRQDGVLMTEPSVDSPPQNGILVAAVPEPSALCIVGVFAGSLLCRRRGR